MTPTDRKREYEVELLTRIGMLCGTGQPTAEQEREAARIAEEHVEAVELQEWKESQG